MEVFICGGCDNETDIDDLHTTDDGIELCGICYGEARADAKESAQPQTTGDYAAALAWLNERLASCGCDKGSRKEFVDGLRQRLKEGK